jgi:hypothetical protein
MAVIDVEYVCAESGAVVVAYGNQAKQLGDKA